MNAMTQHPTEQGVTYWEHLCFAMSVATRLLSAVLAFAIHALLPFISIEPMNDLEATAAFLLERNQWIETASDQKTEVPDRGHQHDSLVKG